MSVAHAQASLSITNSNSLWIGFRWHIFLIEKRAHAPCMLRAAESRRESQIFTEASSKQEDSHALILPKRTV